MLSRRFLIALAASLAFHAAAFILIEYLHVFSGISKAFYPVIQAQLLAPKRDVEINNPTESVLKDMLTEGETQHNSSKTADLRKSNLKPSELAVINKITAQRKLAEHLFYPPEAVAQELEGETRLLLLLDSQGKVLSAQVASSSGHDILDKAAVNAAYAMQRLDGAEMGEMILPVVFKLQ